MNKLTSFQKLNEIIKKKKKMQTHFSEYYLHDLKIR